MKKYSSTLNIFDTDDFTRPSVSAKDLIPLKNNDRFETDALINGRTRYEEKNTIIKSLEEEIVSMKHKLSFVYEKDEEIAKLKDEINELKKENSELKPYSTEVVKLRLESKQLNDELNQLKLTLQSNDNILSENRKLKEKIKTLEIEDIDTLSDDSIKENSIKLIDEPIYELIDINIPQLRSVLFRRLKDKQTKHIEQLIDNYGLKNRNKIKRSIMEKMLSEAIKI